VTPCEHRWDDRIKDFRMASVLAARRHVAAVLDSVKAMPASTWSKDDRVDWMLFRAQLEGATSSDARVNRKSPIRRST